MVALHESRDQLSPSSLSLLEGVVEDLLDEFFEAPVRYEAAANQLQAIAPGDSLRDAQVRSYMNDGQFGEVAKKALEYPDVEEQARLRAVVAICNPLSSRKQLEAATSRIEDRRRVLFARYLGTERPARMYADCIFDWVMRETATMDLGRLAIEAIELPQLSGAQKAILAAILVEVAETHRLGNLGSLDIPSMDANAASRFVDYLSKAERFVGAEHRARLLRQKAVATCYSDGRYGIGQVRVRGRGYRRISLDRFRRGAGGRRLRSLPVSAGSI